MAEMGMTDEELSMRGFLEEFKKFIDRANVLDLAIGVVIGGICRDILSRRSQLKP